MLYSGKEAVLIRARLAPSLAMPAKGKPKPAETVDEPTGEVDFLASDREYMEREDCIGEVVDLLLSKVFAHGEESYLQGLVPRYTADRLINDALAVVNIAYLPREDHCIASMAEVGRLFGPEGLHASVVRRFWRSFRPENFPV